jgi:hypothetical protein
MLGGSFKSGSKLGALIFLEGEKFIELSNVSKNDPLKIKVFF